MLSKMDTESQNLLKSVDAITISINDSNGNANDTSATMEELAASMEEVSATADNINQLTESTAQTVTEIADKSINSAAFVKESSERAYESEKTASEGRKSTNSMVEEIRILAGRSRPTANDIQEISQNVIKAMERLSADAGSMLEFVDATVLKDYDKFVEIAQYYKKDLDYLEEILDKFAVQAEEVRSNTAVLKDGMGGIATAVEESTRGIVMAADATSGLVNNLTSIRAEMTDNHRIADELRQEVNKFR